MKNLSQEKPAKPTLAADGTILLAADSFLRRTKAGKLDPEAEWAFQYVATAFCSDLSLFYPAPKGPTPTATPLFQLWIDNSTVRGNLGISSGEHEHIIMQLREPFMTKVVDDSRRVAQWLDFQFQPEMVVHYLGGGNPTDELVDFAYYLTKYSQLRSTSPIVRELQRLQGETGIPPVLRDVAYRKKLTDLQVALAYVFQAYSKGVSYAWGLGMDPSNPIYRPHWLRESAMASKNLVDERIRENIPYGCFPWGLVLSRIFDPSSPHESPRPERVTDVFEAIRSYSFSADHRWVFELDWPEGDPAEETRIRTALEGFILNGLGEAKLVPLYQHSVLDAITPLTREYASKRIGQVAFDTVVSPLLQPKLLRQSEMAFRRRYRVDSLWKAFLDPGIGDAVEVWRRQRSMAP